MIQPSPYPWHSIERIPRGVLYSLRAIRDALRGDALTTRIAAASSSILGEPVSVIVQRLRPLAPTAPVLPGAVCLLSLDDSLFALVTIEPALAARITATLLGRPSPWVDPSQPPPPQVHAAVGAFVAALARRDAPRPLRVVALDDRARRGFAAAIGTAGVTVETTVLLGHDAFRADASVLVRVRPTSSTARFQLADLRSLGDLPVSLRVVAASSAASSASFAAIGEGDAWLPGEGWTIHRNDQGLFEGNVLLCAPGSALALPAKLHADGRIVLGEGVMQVDLDARTPDADDPSAASAHGEATAADVIADVPVVVRVEVGAVTLTAREWAGLQPGDVVMTGMRIAERAVLRIGGVEVAQGELVDVDGELGVRIHARTSRGGAP